MHLLIAIINDPDKIADILDEFLDIGVKGATVMDSVGMGHLLADHVPFFSRFAEFGADVAHNKTIFVVVRSSDRLKKVVDVIEQIVGDLDSPDTGLVFTLPIDFCKGLSKLERDE